MSDTIRMVVPEFALSGTPYDRQRLVRLKEKAQQQPAKAVPAIDPAVAAHRRQVAELEGQMRVQEEQLKLLQLQAEKAELEKQIAKQAMKGKGLAAHVRMVSGTFNAFNRDKKSRGNGAA